jgi:hypothetical protein
LPAMPAAPQLPGTTDTTIPAPVTTPAQEIPEKK